MDNETRQEIDGRFSRHRRLILLLLGMGIVFNGIIFWALPRSNPPARPLVRVSDVRPTGSVMLCQGDPLTYTFTLTASEAAVVEASTTTLRTSPDVEMYGGDVEREVFPAALTVAHPGEWIAPVDAPPGEYVRLVAVTTPGRITEPTFATLAFTVEACE